MIERVRISHADPRALRGAVDARVAEPIPWIGSGAEEGEATVWFCASSPPSPSRPMPGLRWIHSGFAGIEDWFGRTEWSAGVALTRTVADYPERMTEYVFGYLLARELGVEEALRQMRQRTAVRWTPASLAGRRLLIVGLGAVGRRVASVGRALGMNASGIRRTPAPGGGAAGEEGPEALPTRLAEADVVVNLLPLTRETESFWGAERFGRMRRGAMFVNVSRGATVDEAALRHGLDAGRPGGAILDVFRAEPLAADHWARAHPAVWVTPHVAGVGTVDAMAADFAENWARYRAGLPLARAVDRERGY